MTIQPCNNRSYLIGRTFPWRSHIAKAGGMFDPVRKLWYFRSADTATAFVQALAQSKRHGTALTLSHAHDTGPRVIARARLRGVAYYVTGEGTAEDDAWVDLIDRDGREAPMRVRVRTPKNPADPDAAVIIQRYGRPHSIAELRAYAERARTFGTQACVCACHKTPAWAYNRPMARCARCRCTSVLQKEAS